MLPKRRRAPKMGLSEPSQIRNPSHLSWLRGHDCVIRNAECSGKIEAAHVRIGTDGGTSLKPGDNWTIPCCAFHHAMQHRIGETSFETKYSLSMKDIARAMWWNSPHRRKSEQP